MKRLFQSLCAAVLAVAMAGCAGIPGGEALTAGVAAVSDAFTGPDTDYRNYLTHCRAEVKAKADAAEAESLALQTALSSGNDKTQYGATLIMAFKAGQGGPKINCTAERKKGNMELLLGESDLLQLGMDAYRENRAGERFKKQLEFDAKALKITTDANRDARRDNNRMIMDLTGTRPDEANRSRAEAERLPLPDAPN